MKKTKKVDAGALSDPDFSGVFVPVGFIATPVLSWTERVLLSQIHALDQGDGCHASNEYFAEMLHVAETFVSLSLHRLVRKGYIQKPTIDGSVRAISLTTNALTKVRHRKERKGGEKRETEKEEKKESLRDSKEKRKRTTRFIPPTPEEVEEYAQSIGYEIDGELFCAHYGAASWYRGTTKIRNWKMCVVTWKKKDASKGKDRVVPKIKRSKIDRKRKRTVDKIAGMLGDAWEQITRKHLNDDDEERLDDVAVMIIEYYDNMPGKQGAGSVQSGGPKYFIKSSVQLSRLFCEYLREQYKGFPKLPLSSLAPGRRPWEGFIIEQEQQTLFDFTTGKRL